MNLFYLLKLNTLTFPVHLLFYCFINSGIIAMAERLALIRQQRTEAAKKREEEKAGMVPVANNVLFIV